MLFRSEKGDLEMAVTKRKLMEFLDRLMASVSRENSKKIIGGRLIGVRKLGVAGKAGVWCRN